MPKDHPQMQVYMISAAMFGSYCSICMLVKMTKCVVLQSCTALVWIVFYHGHPSQREISSCWVWLAAVNCVKYGVCHCYQQTFYSHCIVQSVLFSVTDWIMLVKVLSWPYPRREQVFGMWYMTAAVSLKWNILVLINSFQLAVFIVIWRHTRQATAALVQLQQFTVLPFSSIWQLRYRKLCTVAVV